MTIEELRLDERVFHCPVCDAEMTLCVIDDDEKRIVLTIGDTTVCCNECPAQFFLRIETFEVEEIFNCRHCGDEGGWYTDKHCPGSMYGHGEEWHVCDCQKGE
jgi:hypothetical protein